MINAEKKAVLTRDEYLKQMAESKEPLNIRLTNNYAFKKIFKNKVVLKGFLMALLEFGEEEIDDLEVTDPFEEGEDKYEKEGILDIKIHMNNGTKINIEMQNRYQEDWGERSVFYNCRMFAQGFLHGMSSGELEPCIHVGILGFRQLESKGFHHCVMLMDCKSHEVYSSKFLFHVIELSKLKDATNEEKEQELYHWAKMLASDRWEDICMASKGNPYRELVKDELDKINQSEIERWIYLREEMAAIDERSRLLSAEHIGEKKGREESIRATIQICQSVGISKEEMYEKLQKYYLLSEEQAKDSIDKYWEQI